MKLISILLFPFLLFTITACSDSGGSGGVPSPQVSIQNQKPGARRIVVLGDSLAAGQGAQVDANTPTGCLKAGLSSSRVTDDGVPGLTSEEILARVPAVLQMTPKLVFVSSAGNDAISDYYQPGSYPAAKTIREMTQIFDQLIQGGSLVVYLSLNPPLPGSSRLAQVTALAKQKGVIVFDGLQGVWQDTSLMADQFHPNDRGYQIMCQRLLASLKGYYP